MDVVRRNIQAMGGRVEIESMLGIGTRMTVRLPLTLAILDGMSVAVGNQTYILPLSYVIESCSRRLGISAPGQPGAAVQVRGDYLPVVVAARSVRPGFGVEDFTQGIMVVSRPTAAKAPCSSTPGRPAPGGDQEPGSQLPPGARHLRRDHHGRRPCGADSRCLGDCRHGQNNGAEAG
jgi:hypothetical protein